MYASICEDKGTKIATHNLAVLQWRADTHRLRRLNNVRGVLGASIHADVAVCPKCCGLSQRDSDLRKEGCQGDSDAENDVISAQDQGALYEAGVAAMHGQPMPMLP